tara:strand:+ start:32 stop:889 length:858 start_codon:yes stop_codon:yes gene_type:complete
MTGGLAILISSLISFVFFINNTADIYQTHSTLNLLLLISFIYFLLGLFDDIFNLSPFLRLSLQFLASIYSWFSGIRIEAIDISLLHSTPNILSFPNSISLLITSFWIVGIVNAINWIDGLDGLATGMSIIILAALHFILISSSSSSDLAFYLLSIIGVCFVFLWFNFYRSQIIMGDSGSSFLGSTIALMSIFSLNEYSIFDANLNVFDFNIAFLILFIPIVDMSVVIFTRIKDGISPFYPDKRHLHHKLIALGFSQKHTVYIIQSVSLVLVLISLLIKYSNRANF